MAEIKYPIQINLNLPDDWIEQIVNRLRNDPEAEWVEIIRCKDCKLFGDHKCLMYFDGYDWAEPDGYCHIAEERREE